MGKKKDQMQCTHGEPYPIIMTFHSVMGTRPPRAKPQAEKSSAKKVISMFYKYTNNQSTKMNEDSFEK